MGHIQVTAADNAFLKEDDATREKHRRLKTEGLFLERGMQYYVSARFAAILGFMPVAGNQFHHAIEMFLKSQLAFRGVSLRDLYKEFRHDLVKIWEAFKAGFPAEDLSGFNELVSRLDQWDDIRYPDDVLKNGMIGQIDWTSDGTPIQVSGPHSNSPRYELSVLPLDRLVVKILRLSGRTSSRGLRHELSHGKGNGQCGFDALYYENAEKAYWEN